MMENKNKQLGLVSRPPVVVVLGHVDHGKTTLLDYIRKTKVAEKEAGGITQHIGAYEIEVGEKGKEKRQILRSAQDDFSTISRKITFIDTPGHESFAKMRSRGAKVADIAILVVAGDEGVKSQTKESIKIIQEAEIPFIVAITKIDKPTVNLEKVKNELTELGVLLEGRGGNVPWVGVSSKTGQGIDELLELIILLSEMEELKADPDKPASGIVIESRLDRFRGNTATLVVTDGALCLKDEIRAGEVSGKVKILEDFQGKPIKKATFSAPVRVVGFESLAPVGEKFFAGKSEVEVIKPAINFKKFVKELGKKNSEIRIPLIIKSDTFGSSEALEEIIDQLGKENDWTFLILKNEVGDISGSDFKIIPSEKTLIIGFRVKKKPEINNLLLTDRNLILVEGNVIYEIKDKVEEIVKQKFIEKPTEEIIGKLEVLAIFNPVKGNQLIGGRILEGKVQNKNNFYLMRGEEKIGQGKILNLQKNRAEVLEARRGEECGLLVSGVKEQIEKGDLLVFFKKI
ncbi:MAG: GTP-binding protein [Candidatus Pacebacteria bacterium]|nr:GTP-binding protein [Candidatus Paceibacterota bacterium]